MIFLNWLANGEACRVYCRDDQISASALRNALVLLRFTFCAAALTLVAGPANAAGMQDHVIAVGDELRLDILNDGADAFQMSVGGGGEVQLPFLGTYELAGLTLSTAREEISESYVRRGILLSPQIDLSVINLRPFSVLGDVRSPGFFDYRPGITVEQAVGLAGGTARSDGSEEARSLQRIALRGERANTESAILSVAVSIARLRAQLGGARQIEPSDLAKFDGVTPAPALVDTLIAQENEIIAAERDHFQQDRALIEKAVEEVTRQISLTKDQIAAQRDQIASYDAELASNADLSDRGLVTAPVRARLLRQVADEETALIRLEAGLAATRRDYTNLQRELLGQQYRRAQEWRQELVESDLRLTQLRQTRDTILERTSLLDSFALRASEAGVSWLIYTVRRATVGEAAVAEAVQPTDPLSPGDVLIVEAGGPGRGAMVVQ